ncbi:DMT family transporter [Anseongella ginsenosidimutans]|nr:DMT family transporter [Anseongella ginsenosidimutans]
MRGKSSVFLGGFAITLAGAILFSTKAIFVKQAFRDTGTDVLSLLAVRMLFALPFYLAAAFYFSRQKENVRFTGRQWVLIILLGILGYYLSSLFDFIGLQYISAGLERLILFLYPTFTVLLNMLLFRQPVTRRQGLALALIYGGAVIAYLGELNISGFGRDIVTGSLWILLCAMTFAMYLIGSGRMIKQVGDKKFTAYAMLAATAGVLLHSLAVNGEQLIIIKPGLIWYGLLLAVVATVLPSFMIANGLKRIGSNNVSIISAVGPVSTILQAHWFLGEPIFAGQLAGTALVIGGILLIGWKAGSGEGKEIGSKGENNSGAESEKRNKTENKPN